MGWQFLCLSTRQTLPLSLPPSPSFAHGNDQTHICPLHQRCPARPLSPHRSFHVTAPRASLKASPAPTPSPSSFPPFFFRCPRLSPLQSAMASNSLAAWLRNGGKHREMQLRRTSSGGFAAQVQPCEPQPEAEAGGSAASAAEAQPSATFDMLPYELKIDILMRLDPSSIVAASQVCRSWRAFASDLYLVRWWRAGGRRGRATRAGADPRPLCCACLAQCSVPLSPLPVLLPHSGGRSLRAT